MIKTKNLTYKYEDGTIALKDINIDMSMGNIIGKIGSNGSGKTTLFLNLLGILRPTKGEISFNDKGYKYNKKSLINLRKSVGIVFQDSDIEKRMIEILKNISKTGKKIVIASHDMDLIYNICDYGYVLNKGSIVASDKIENVFLMEETIKKLNLRNLG